MRRSNRRALCWALLLLPLLLAGCPGLPIGDPVCTYSWPASAYEDVDGDGVRAADEPALANVRLLLKRVRGDTGRAEMQALGTGAEPVELSPTGIGFCPKSMEVSATAPRGYTPTTATTATVTGKPQAAAPQSGAPLINGVAFGFRWTGGARPAPAPTGEARPYATHIEEGYFTGYTFTSNGDLWVARDRENGPLWRYRAGEKGEVFQTEGFNRACGIVADERDVLWMGICAGGGAGGGGVMRFAGDNGWRRYTTADGLLSNEVYGLHRAADGSIWATHPSRKDGYSRLDPQTGQWQALPELKELYYPTNGPGGRLWFRSDTALVTMQPGDPLKTRRDMAVPPIDGKAVNLVADPVITEDSAWCLGSYGDYHEQVLVRYELQGARWTLYTWESTGGAMPLAQANNLHRLPDGGIFVYTLPFGGYKLIPGNGSDPSAWQMVQYPQFAQKAPEATFTDDRGLLEQLIWVRWGGSSTYGTLVK